MSLATVIGHVSPVRYPGALSGCRHFPLVIYGLLSAILLLVSATAPASVSVYVGKNLTKDGSVLLAGFGDEPSSHWLSIMARRQHPDDATIQVGATAAADMPGELIEIPQAAETFRYISMNYSYYRGFPAPLTNGGMNEYGVAVRDVSLYSRPELAAMTPKGQTGLNYSDIARIVLERAQTAREAVDIAVELIERYGDATYGGNSHMFADPNEGWVLLEFAGGKGLWVARRLGPDDIWLNWRGYNEDGYIQTLPANWREDPDYLASDNFVSFAVDQGWYDPRADAPFDVIEVYTDTRPEESDERTAAEARKVQAVLRSAAPEVVIQDLMKLLHSAGRDSSGYGQIAHLRADIESDLRTLWVAPGPPPTAPFIPWRIGVQSVPAEFRRHRYLTAGEAQRSVDSAQQGLESTRYANRAVKRLLYLVQEHREVFLPEVAASLTAFEDRQLTAQSQVDRIAQVLIDGGERALARRYLTEQANTAAGHAMHLLEVLAESIEARTKLLYGIRHPDDAGD